MQNVDYVLTLTLINIFFVDSDVWCEEELIVTAVESAGH